MSGRSSGLAMKRIRLVQFCAFSNSCPYPLRCGAPLCRFHQMVFDRGESLEGNRPAEFIHLWVEGGFQLCKQPNAPSRRNEPAKRAAERDQFGLVISGANRAALRTLFLQGISSNEIARQTGINKNIVGAFRKSMEDKTPCACGQPAGHRGWCAVRFAKSSKRQEFMKRFGRSERDAGAGLGAKG